MVKVTYECDETGQKMITTFKEGDEPREVDLKITFEPEIDDKCKDPFGVMQKLFDAFQISE